MKKDEWKFFRTKNNRISYHKKCLGWVHDCKQSYRNMKSKYIKDFMENARTYIEMPKLTPELLRVFIHRIDVYEKEEKYSRTCGNTIMIHYTFKVSQSKTATAINTATAKQKAA